MLIKYIRNSNQQRIGVVVATDANKVGYSLCNKKDKWNKEKGLQIAKGRAYNGFNHQIPDSVYLEYYAMIDRSYRYFKN